MLPAVFWHSAQQSSGWNVFKVLTILPTLRPANNEQRVGAALFTVPVAEDFAVTGTAFVTHSEFTVTDIGVDIVPESVVETYIPLLGKFSS